MNSREVKAIIFRLFIYSPGPRWYIGIMEDTKSTTIVPISFYCFFLGGYLVYLAVNSALSSKSLMSGQDMMMWLPIAACGIFGGGIIAVGCGILNMSKVCWKILFFSLAICVSCLASLLITFLVFLIMDVKALTPYFHEIKTNSMDWFAFLGVFLSEIIVLYYLCSGDVVAMFGDMGPLISPF